MGDGIQVGGRGLNSRSALAILVVVALSGSACGGDQKSSEVGAPTPGTETTETTRTNTSADEPEVDGATDFAVSDVATGLDTVWALAFAPDGSLHFTERGGRIGRMTRESDGSYGKPKFEDVEGVVEQGEGGLMGLAIDEGGRRFVMFTSATDNRIAELRADGSLRILARGIKSGSIHNGGRLAIGPDGNLYAATGDAGDRSSPRREGLNGRILRIRPDTSSVEVVSTGHRNPQGLCFDSEGRLLSTEHGPDRGDEVNLIEKGSDYGWPETEGTGIANWTPTIAPAGCAVYAGDAFPGLRGRMLFTTLKDRSLRQLDLATDGRSAKEKDALISGNLGRLRDVAVGPDGEVFVATSNRDGRGDPKRGDDRIVRLIPKN